MPCQLLFGGLRDARLAQITDSHGLCFVLLNSYLRVVWGVLVVVRLFPKPGVGGRVVVRANILGTVIGPSGQDLSRSPD